MTRHPLSHWAGVRIDAKPAPGLIEVIGPVDGILARSSAHAHKVECPGYMNPSPRSYGLPVVTRVRHRSTPPGTSAGHHNWTEYKPSQEIYEAWQALPLIVLAGLR